MNTNELKKLAEAATPGPWVVTIDGTCSGAWPQINSEQLDEDGDPYTYTVAELPTSHLETVEAFIGDEMPGPYSEKPHRFAEDPVSNSLKDAAFIAAANPKAVLELIAERDELLEALENILDSLRQRRPGRFSDDAAAADAAIAKAKGAALAESEGGDGA